MIEKAFETIEDNKLLDDVEFIILGFSGGPDSTFLSEVLSGQNVNVLHAYFNHNLREDSREEEEFIKSIGEKRNLDLKIGGGDVEDYCREKSVSLEEGARKLRMNFLKGLMEEENADCIALGHNLDDRVENFFIRLLRGSGFGLASMNYRDGEIIRPLLDLRKDEIIRYLAANEIKYYRDPSNKNLNILRNSIRKKLIPVLENIDENAVESINRSIHNLEEIRRMLEREISKIKLSKYRNYVSVARDVFQGLSKSGRFLLFRRMLSVFERELSLKRKHIQNLPDKGIVKLKGAYLEVGEDRVIVAEDFTEKERDLECPDSILFGNFEINTEVVNKVDDVENKGVEFFDCEKIEFPLRVRVREDGDRIKLLGREGHGKIKDIFIDGKIPRLLRERWPVVCDSRGIILIPGLKRAGRALITEETEKILKIKFREVKDG